MPIYNIITLLGFGFGTALTIVLLSLSVKKMPKRYDDYAFGVVMISCVLWHGGNFLALLLEMLFGSVVSEGAKIALGFGYFGLAAMPSALLHVHLGIFYRAKLGPHRPLNKPQIFSLAATYLPMIIFLASKLPALGQGQPLSYISASLAKSFSIWILISIIASIAISGKLTKILKLESEQHYYRDMSYMLAGIGLGLILVYIIPIYRLAYVGQYLNLVMQLSPSFPLAVLAYYVYRYNFYRLVVKPSLIYSIIYGIVMAIYLLGIRKIGEYLSQFPEVNSTFIEGLLLVALVFAFQPLRSQIQVKLDKIFFKDRYYYQQFLRELSDSISHVVDLEKLLQIISQALTSTLKAKTCTLVVFNMIDDKPVIYKTFGNQKIENVESLVDALNATRHFRLRRQMRDHRVRLALNRNRFEIAFPIYSRDTLIGLICLSEKQTGNDYTDEEFDVLQTFANQIALAFLNARLVQDRLDLEAKIYQSEKLNSLGQLATTIAHEIKNPLSSIKTIIQVLRENAREEDAEDLDVVIKEINRLNTVLDKLLSFARPSEANVDRVNVSQIITDAIALLKHQAKKSNITINYSEIPSPIVVAKKQSVREIVFNLILNSLQAMPNGGKLDISLSKSTEAFSRSRLTGRGHFPNSEKWLQILIKDNGPGIPEENLNRILEPFFTTKTVGAGLGLAIVKRNVEELGGYLEVKSNPKMGTQFKVLLPFAAHEMEYRKK